MNEDWYEKVGSHIKITQGDIIFDCPLTAWKNAPIELTRESESEVLKAATDIFRADVIVMTQACDLENEKVRNLILCPHTSLSVYRQAWEAEMKSQKQVPTPKAWKTHCNDICEGFQFNLTMLDSGGPEELRIEHRVVDFSEVFTLPREFLEGIISLRNLPRLRLLPPYREYLSQAFARFFMRVGLPSAVKKNW
jgi:hypothetical protein